MKNLGIIVLLGIFISITGCFADIKKRNTVYNSYSELVQPVDTSFVGVVESIKLVQIKRFGDLLYSQINQVIINSDTIQFDIRTDEISFNIGDSVSVYIDKNTDSKIYKTITYIYKYGECIPSETVHGTTNIYYRNKRNKAIEQLKN